MEENPSQLLLSSAINKREMLSRWLRCSVSPFRVYKQEGERLNLSQMSLPHRNLWPGVAFHLTVNSHNPWGASSSTASQLPSGVVSLSLINPFPSPFLCSFLLLILWISILCHVVKPMEIFGTCVVIIDSWREMCECRRFRKKNNNKSDSCVITFTYQTYS